MFNFIKRLEKVEDELKDMPTYVYVGGQPVPTIGMKVRQLKTRVTELESRLSLLESHLNLTYIPEGKSEARYEITKRKFEDRVFGGDEWVTSIDKITKTKKK